MQATDTGTIFTVDGKRTTDIYSPVNTVKYDLIGEVAQNVGLLRKTVAYILSGIHPENSQNINQILKILLYKSATLLRL